MAVHTGSDYLRNGATRWIEGWNRRGWKTQEGQPVQNRELWERLEKAMAARRVTWPEVKGRELRGAEGAGSAGEGGGGVAPPLIRSPHVDQGKRRDPPAREQPAGAARLPRPGDRRGGDPTGQGTEVKSVRDGRVQLKDSYVEFKNGQAWLVGVHISPYSHGNRENHEPGADAQAAARSKRQIDRLFGRTQLKGLTVVPLSVYLKGNWIKVEIALVQGKKQYDKRETEKTRELDREVGGRGQERPW